ncbi:hypothetical protein GCM10009863_46390 [Streptomyces axinellae]|uniref:Nucleotide pyrophosphohydrolase n=1 Tax=Streptomyces axinellae TaxID=552788 RepID=A0ABN3QH02_9ACTN
MSESPHSNGHSRPPRAAQAQAPQAAQTPQVPQPRTVAGLQRRLAEFAAARDWRQYHTPKNLSAALSVEAGELVEIFQWLTPEQSARVMADTESAARVEDEVADVLAYLLQFCDVLGVDVLAALDAKIERNEKRFPTPGSGHSME